MKFIAALTILAASVSAHAGDIRFVNGAEFTRIVQAYDRIDRGTPKHDDYQDASMLLGFVLGVAESSSDLCLPQGVTVGQLSSVVAQFHARNPERWNYGGKVLTRAALRVAFPCK